MDESKVMKITRDVKSLDRKPRKRFGNTFLKKFATKVLRLNRKIEEDKNGDFIILTNHRPTPS